MSAAPQLVDDACETEQRQVELALRGIMEAAKDKDFGRLAAYHLHSPKFTKFDDFEPLDRQDAPTAQRAEEEGLGSVNDFHYELRDLKIDVFGLAAIATFVFDYGFESDGEAIAVKSRATMVFVDDAGSWKIAHEHFSPFKSHF